MSGARDDAPVAPDDGRRTPPAGGGGGGGAGGGGGGAGGGGKGGGVGDGGGGGNAQAGESEAKNHGHGGTKAEKAGGGPPLGTHASQTTDHPRSHAPGRPGASTPTRGGAGAVAEPGPGPEPAKTGKSAAGESAGEDAEAGEGNDDLFRLDLSKELSGLEALLSDDFARVSTERDEYLNALQRLQADFDNYRKRAERQFAEARERANEALLVKLLPVLDALDLAVAHLRQAESPGEAAGSLVQIHTLLRDTLAREGLERIDSVGVPFDPTIHEATAMDDSEAEAHEAGDEPAGPAVTEVWRPGYRMGDRVIRPAMVRVRG